MKRKFNTELLWMAVAVIVIVGFLSLCFWASFTVFERERACLEHGYPEYTSGYCIRIVDGNSQTADVKKFMEE